MKVLFVLLPLALVSASEPEAITTASLDQEEPLNIITNGYIAPEGKAPYIVFLSFRNSRSGSWCGGSMIGHTWVVTASHCSKGFSSVTIYYGSNQRAQGSISHTVSGSNIINHPSDDIALIRTPHVAFSARINRVRLPSFSDRGNLYVNQWTTACGWGQTTSTKTPENLQCVDAPVISNAQCARIFGSRTVHRRVLCTSTLGGRSICFGDSGGPLVTQSNPILIGVTHFVSAKGCTAGEPAGFTRITSHLDWIRLQTGIAY
ncbi:serine protease 3 [Drosophila grimshawi]|uniref:GH12809 n=1 Tax=Drosophila grimshawi TaxID=7222 RepID=B4K309_DROGR|nr:serine protease 3 [Drosophila grimshawi]EDW04859.1 GH12809 [Drosophila grimshawi]